MDSHITIQTKSSGTTISSRVTIHLKENEMKTNAERIIRKAAHSVMKDQLKTFFSNETYIKKRKYVDNYDTSVCSSSDNSNSFDLAAGSTPHCKRRKVNCIKRELLRPIKSREDIQQSPTVDISLSIEDEKLVDDWLNSCMKNLPPANDTDQNSEFQEIDNNDLTDLLH